MNIGLSTPDARFRTADIRNFYLSTEIERPDYMKIKINLIPQEIIDEHNVMEYAVNGFAYFEITKGMYGLQQAGKLEKAKFIKELSVKGFEPTNHTTGLWKHKTRPVTFALVVDDFESITPIRRM